MAGIILRNLNKTFDLKTKAVSDVNLEVKNGEFFTFLGPSGCGKTTILRMIAGFLECDPGSHIYFDEKEMTEVPPEKRKLGIVFQNYALFPHMNVYENIAYGLKLKKISKGEIDRKVKDVLEMVKMTEHMEKDINQLSGGQQQRIAIARAIAMEPKVLLLDEPFSNLDAKLKEELLLEIRTIQKKIGITTIFVTHDQTEAMLTSDRIAIFEKGRCVQIGTPREIYKYPKTLFVAEFIGKTNILTVEDFKEIFGSEPYLENEKINYIALRPEKIILSQNPVEGQLSGKGKLLAKEFAGFYELMKIEIGQKQLTVINSQLGEKVTEGQDLYLGIMEDNYFPLED